MPRGEEDRGPRSVRRLFLWLTGLFVAALGAAIVAGVSGIPGQLVDLDSVKDGLRPGADLRARVDVIHLDDQGFSVAFADEYTPTALQRQLASDLSYENRERLSDDLRQSGGADVEKLTLQVVKPESALVFFIYAETVDPYGELDEILARLHALGANYFAVDPVEDAVLLSDLPRETQEALSPKQHAAYVEGWKRILEMRENARTRRSASDLSATDSTTEPV